MITVAARQRLLTLLAVALTLSLIPALAAEHQAATIEALFADLDGSYRMAPDDANAGIGGAPPHLTAHYAAVFAPAIGANVAYWQLDAGEDSRVYRQALLVFEPDGDGNFRQRAYNFRTPEDYVHGHTRPDIFIGIQPDDIVPAVADSCISTWSLTEQGWSGIMAADSCRMFSERRNTWRLISAEVLPRGDSLLYVERGFSEDGEMLFGLPDGEHYDLKRIQAEASAND